jgi:phosphohistidine phosphatase
MNLYLVRHGDAVSKEENPERPLSESGAESARLIGRFLGPGVLRSVSEVRHSTKLRARQTAELICAEAGVGAELIEVSNIEPMADVGDLAAELSDAPDDVVLVGHLPHLDRLASKLVAGEADREAFSFETCSVLCLRRMEGSEPAAWAVAWMVYPGLLAGH